MSQFWKTKICNSIDKFLSVVVPFINKNLANLAPFFWHHHNHISGRDLCEVSCKELAFHGAKHGGNDTDIGLFLLGFHVLLDGTEV